MSDCSITACANPHAVLDVKAKALRLFDEGLTHFDVAKYCGTTEWQVLEWLEEAQEAASLASIDAKIKELMNKGLAPSEIGEMLGMKPNDVRLHVVEYWRKDKERPRF